MSMRQRRFLPSLSQLLAFEAVMQHHSVTAAAEELYLTQSTVSRLVQSLEAQLGITLFLRHRKKLVPTDAAIAYQVDISRAIDIIHGASIRAVANPEGGTLSLAVLPTFATRWLGPRLGRFLDEHPGISMNLSTRLERFNFETEPFDAAICFGDNDWPGTHGMKLFDERLTACVSTDFLSRNPISTPADMAGLPRLQLESRKTGWEDWFAGQNATVRGTSGMVMDQFSMMIQAAISGLGIALLPDYLAQNEIREGRLQPVLKQNIPGQGAYWLVWPHSRDTYAPLSTFRAWFALQTSEPLTD
ncbi:LysR family transcriptional regulator [Granulosicoccus antarcticus]|nr:LysR family transcriptional regulator [Granulosicoccus antarcticus]